MKTSSSYLPVALAALLLVMGHSLARGDTFSAYQLRPALQFSFPDVTGAGKTQGPTVFDVLGDGRILAAVTQASGASGTPLLYVQHALYSTTFDPIGALATGGFFPSFGASFMAISRDGTKGVINDNDEFIGVFSIAQALSNQPTTPVTWIDTGGFTFAGTWVDNNIMAVSKSATIGSGAEVAFLNTSTQAITTIVTGTNGSSDVLFDYDAGGNPNNMYMAEGFGIVGGPPTGQIRKFTKAAWQGAQSSGIPLSFSSGTVVTTFSTAGNLDFDNAGNLIIGGGPTANVDGLGIFRPSDSSRRTFDPAATSGNSYYTVYNKVTGEIYVNEPFPAGAGSSRTVYVIAPVPEPGTFLLAFVGFGLICSRFALSKKGS